MAHAVGDRNPSEVGGIVHPLLAEVVGAKATVGMQRGKEVRDLGGW